MGKTHGALIAAMFVVMGCGNEQASAQAPAVHPYLPSLPAAAVPPHAERAAWLRQMDSGIFTSSYETVLGGPEGNAASGYKVPAAEPMIPDRGAPASASSPPITTFKWGTPFEPSVYQSMIGNGAQAPSLMAFWLNADGTPRTENVGPGNYDPINQPWGARFNVNLSVPLAKGDFLPIAETLGMSSEALVPVSMLGASPGFGGRTRPTLEGVVDLITGRPIVQVTDLELPFGSAVFRLNRTRSSLTRHELSTQMHQKWMGATDDQWWDWAGHGWMLSENPLLIVDSRLPDVVGSDPATTWLVLDAHRSIPFQMIEGTNRYESPPRFRAVLEHNGQRGLVGRGGCATGAQVPADMATKLVWVLEPTEFRVHLYEGALTYHFALVPKQWTDPATSQARTAGLIPRTRYDFNYLQNGNDGWTNTCWLDSDYADAPYVPKRLRALVNPNDKRHDHRSWGPPLGLQGAAQGPTGVVENVPIGLVDRQRPGLGLPQVALLRKISDKHGNEAHIEYVHSQSRVIHEPGQNKAVSMLQDGPAIGQIKALHLVSRRRGVSGEIERRLDWSLLYVHRATRTSIKLPEPLNDDAAVSAAARNFVLEALGTRALDRVLVYKGGVTRATLDMLDRDHLTVPHDDESGFDPDGRVLNGEPDKRPAVVVALNQQPELANWSYQVRYQYTLYTEDGPLTEPPTCGLRVANSPLLVMTSIDQRFGEGELSQQRHMTKRRLYMYDLAAYFQLLGQDSQFVWWSEWRHWQSPHMTLGPSLRGILENDDVERMLRATRNNEPNQPLAVGLTLEQAALMRENPWNVFGRDGVGDKLEMERALEFASVRYDEERFPSLDVGNTSIPATEPDPSVPPASQEPRSLLPSMEKLVASGSGSTAYLTQDRTRLLWDNCAGVPQEVSVRAGGQMRHYRVMRFLLAPDGSLGIGDDSVMLHAEWKTPGGSTRPTASMFVNPYRWSLFSEPARDNLIIPDLSQAPGSVVAGGATQLTGPRYVVVIDEFVDRDRMMCYNSRRLLAAENPYDDEAREARRVAYRNAAGTMKGQLSRRVIEINAWGYALKERVWQFNQSTGEPSVTTSGIGEEYVYTPVKTLFPSVEQTLGGLSAEDEDVRRATRAYADELLLTEKRTFSHAVAASQQLGANEGLIEFTTFVEVDGGQLRSAAELRRYPWSSRIRAAGSGIRRGTSGAALFRTQTFYGSSAPWSIEGQISFTTPQTQLLPSLPLLSVGAPHPPDLPGEVTRHHTVYVRNDMDNPHLTIGQWRVAAHTTVRAPIRQQPGGPLYYPFEACIGNMFGEMQVRVVGLAQNPLVANDQVNVTDANAYAVVTWQNQAVPEPWAVVQDVRLTSELGNITSEERVGPHGQLFTIFGYDPQVPAAQRWQPLPATRSPLYHTTITEQDSVGVRDRYTGPALLAQPGIPIVSIDWLRWSRIEVPVQNSTPLDTSDDQLVIIELSDLQPENSANLGRINAIEIPFRTQSQAVLKVLPGDDPREQPIRTQNIEIVGTSVRLDVPTYAGTVDSLLSGQALTELKWRVKEEVRLTLDTYGRPMRMDKAERVWNGELQGYEWLETGSTLVNDLSDVARIRTVGGNITRMTRNWLGQVMRKYVGTADENWGSSQALLQSDIGYMSGGVNNMVLRERYEYGTGVNDIFKLTATRRYHSVPSSGGMARNWTQMYYDVPPAQDADGVATMTSYDWRQRAVKVIEYRRGVPMPELIERTTLTYLDHADRVKMVVVLGPAHATPSNLDPVNFGVLGYSASEGQVPPAAAWLAQAPRPLSIVEYVHDLSGQQIETRTYDMGAPLTADVPAHMAERRYVGFMGKEVWVQQPGSAVTRIKLDGLGRVQSSIVASPLNPEMQLERTDYVYNHRGQVIEQTHWERLQSPTIVGATHELSATNAVAMQTWIWYDSGGRQVVRAEMGTGQDAFAPPTGVALAARPALAATLMPELVDQSNPRMPQALVAAANTLDVLGARVWLTAYNGAGQAVVEREPGGLETVTLYSGDKIAEKIERDPSQPQLSLRRTMYTYRLGRLERVNTYDERSGEMRSETRALYGRTDAEALGYGLGPAEVVDREFNVVSADLEAVATIWQGSADATSGQAAVARLRYYMDGKLAERTDAHGVSMRYSYDDLGRLTDVRIGSYPNHHMRSWEPSSWQYAGMPYEMSVENQGDPVDRQVHVRVERSYVPGSYGGRREQVTVKAWSGDTTTPSIISANRLEMDESGRLLREVQSHGSEIIGSSTPAVDYVWSVQHANVSTATAGSSRLERMDYPAVANYARRSVTMGYGTGVNGAIDSSLNRLRLIRTHLDNGSSHPVMSTVAGFHYMGAERRLRQTRGGSAQQPYQINCTLDIDPLTPGLEGLDRFGRVRALEWHNTNSAANTLLQSHRFVYDGAGNRVADVTQHRPSSGLAGAWSAGDERSQLHEYDLLGRLIRSQYSRITLPPPQAPPTAPSGSNAPVIQLADRWLEDVRVLDVDGNPLSRERRGNLDLHGTPWALTGSDSAGDELVDGGTFDDRSRYATSTQRIDSGPATPRGLQYDAAGNLRFDGKHFYAYDAWNRLVQVNAAEPNGAGQLRPGPLVKHFTYDGLGRLIRTQSPFPDPIAGGGLLRSERFYYDGARRITEVVIDPVESIQNALLSSDPAIALYLHNLDAELDLAASTMGLETKQLLRTEAPPPVELSREYVYGPAHVDELLVQYTGHERELPWWLIGDSFDGEGGGGNVTTVCTPGVPDGSGGVYESLVAFQCVYDAHGVVVAASRNLAHPPLHAGFKGLFAERLDGGVSETMLGDDRPRLVPGGTVIYHNRNRTLHAGLGRFLQCDPNATGLLTQPGLSYGGTMLGLSPSGASLDALVGDGTNLYQYARGNTGRWGDPSGLFVGPGFDAYMEYNEEVLYSGGEAGYMAAVAMSDYAERLDLASELAMDWSAKSDAEFATLLGAPTTPTTQSVSVPAESLAFQTMAALSGEGPAMASITGAGTAAKIARKAKRAASRAMKFGEWLNSGPKNVDVYYFTRNGLTYVGISNDTVRRGKEHGIRPIVIARNLTRRQARAIETFLILQLRARGIPTSNSILSVAQQNPHFAKAMNWAEARIGFLKIDTAAILGR